MDSASPALPLPPSPGISAYVPPGPQGFQPPPQAPAPQAASVPAQRPVGRPNTDPDVQEQRVERAVLKQRLKNILPAAMTDGKIAIYRLQGRRGRTKDGKPVMGILFGALEKAMTDGNYTDTGVFIEDTLRAKYGDKGRFLWEAQDAHGRLLSEAGAYEIDLGSESDNYTEDNMDDENDTGLPQAEPAPSLFPPQVAPAPPPFDPAIHAQTVRGIITEEKKSAESMVTVLMTMMQAQNQQNMAAMQAAQAAADRRREEDERRREREEREEREERKMELERMRIENERREKEEQRRDDRERERRQQEQAMQMQFFQAIFNKPDTMTPMLMKMVDSKGDRDGMKEVFGMMSEASKQAMVTQGEATKHMLSAQADASKLLMSNVMNISQTMVEQMAQSQAEPTDDPMEKVGRVFKMIAPVLTGLNQNTQQTVAAVQPQAHPQRIAQQPQQIPPKEYIKGGLYTIMRLENAQIPARQRFQALKWCAENLPRPMLDAIRSGNQDSVLAIGAEGMDDTLMAWISDTKHMEFLQDCVVDIQRMLLGAMTQADAKASFEKHMAYMQAKGQPVQEAAPAQPVAESSIPAEVKDADLAQPVAEKPANGKRSAPPPSDKPIVEDDKASQN